jgi:hypothetical protein
MEAKQEEMRETKVVGQEQLIAYQEVPNEEAAVETREYWRTDLEYRNSLKRQTQGEVIRETPKGRTSRGNEGRPECSNGMRGRSIRQQLRLGSKRTLNSTHPQAGHRAGDHKETSLIFH